MTTRKGRSRPRPLAVHKSMHLVLRSSKAKGTQSFRYRTNAQKIRQIIAKFSDKFHVKILALAIVGNHIHLHIQLVYRHTYKRFIRALTASIAMLITGHSRWHPKEPGQKGFFDRRPFTRIVQGFKDRLRLKDYIEVNQLEGFGHSRIEARDIIAEWKENQGPPLWMRG